MELLCCSEMPSGMMCWASAWAWTVAGMWVAFEFVLSTVLLLLGLIENGWTGTSWGK